MISSISKTTGFNVFIYKYIFNVVIDLVFNDGWLKDEVAQDLYPLLLSAEDLWIVTVDTVYWLPHIA